MKLIENSDECIVYYDEKYVLKFGSTVTYQQEGPQIFSLGLVLLVCVFVISGPDPKSLSLPILALLFLGGGIGFILAVKGWKTMNNETAWMKPHQYRITIDKQKAELKVESIYKKGESISHIIELHNVKKIEIDYHRPFVPPHILVFDADNPQSISVPSRELAEEIRAHIRDLLRKDIENMLEDDSTSLESQNLG